jgi:hypothetical protein
VLPHQGLAHSPSGKLGLGAKRRGNLHRKA